MKIKIDKSHLMSAFQRMSGIISERNSQNLYFSAENNRFEISGSDLAISSQSFFDTEVQAPGSCFSHAKLIFDFVKELPEGAVKIEKLGSHLKITAGKNENITIKTSVVDPVIASKSFEVKAAEKINISAELLSYLIDQVQNIILPNVSTTNYGTVAFLQSLPTGILRLVGCDSFRLSMSEIYLENSADFLRKGVCLTRRSLQELQRICRDGFEELTLGISSDGSTLIAEVPDYIVYIRLSNMKYPSYEMTLNNQQNHEISLNSKEIISVLRRILLASDKNSNLYLNFADSSVSFRCHNMGNMEAKETINMDNAIDFSGDITLNGKFFLETLNTIQQSENFVFKFKDQNQPIIITPQIEPQGCRTIHLIVPIEESKIQSLA